MTGESVGACLDRLASALSSLDHAAVGVCVDELELLRDDLEGRLKTGRQDTILPHRAALLVQLRHSTALAVAAERLYAGWLQMAAPDGAAYMRGGDRTPALAASEWKVDG